MTEENHRTVRIDVQRLRFYRPDNMFCVESMSYDPPTKRLAILKRIEGGQCSQIEIWLMGQAKNVDYSIPIHLQTVHEDDEEMNCLEQIAWGNDNRFFSCGLKSTFHEHDLSTNLVKKTFSVGGGPVWCLSCDSSRSRLALGSDDGSVSIFQLGSDVSEVSFGKLLGKCSSRVLSIIWANDSLVAGDEGEKHTRVITGSIDYIYIWSYRKGTCLDKLLVGSNQVCVWSLAVWDRTLIAGDSNGVTSFWDLKTRVKKDSFKKSEGDVLAIAVDDNGSVFSAGSDPRIAVFQIDEDKVYPTQYYIEHHKHDVKGLCIGPKGVLLSAGYGPHLSRGKSDKRYDNQVFWKIRNNIIVDDSSLLIRFQKRLEIYSCQTNKPEMLAVIKSKRSIIGSTMKGNLIAYWTSRKLCVVRRQETMIMKLPHDLSESTSPLSFHDVFFIPNELGMGMGIVINQCIITLKIEESDVSVENTVEFPSRIYKVIPTMEAVVVVLESQDIYFFKTTGEDELKPTKAVSLNYLPVDCAADIDNNVIWFLLPDHSVTSWNVMASSINQGFLIHRSLRRHNLYDGILVVGESVLLYSDDRILSFDSATLKVKSAIEGYQFIIKLGLASDKPCILTLVEVPRDVLMKLLPAKLDCKANRFFHR